MLLQHICKAGNGSIPKPPKKDTSKKNKDRGDGHEEPGSSSDILKAKSERTAEEKLAREFQVLYKDVTGKTILFIGVFKCAICQYRTMNIKALHAEGRSSLDL